MQARVWRDGQVLDDPADLDHAVGAVTDGGCIGWLHLTADELRRVAPLLDLDPEAVADAVDPVSDRDEVGQRTKYERYRGHIFVYLHAVDPADRRDEALRLVGVPVFVSRHVLVTVDRGTGGSAHDLAAQWEAEPALAEHGTAALLYTVLDGVVDTHLDALDTLAAQVEEMEEWLFDAPADEDPRDLQRRSYATRKSLVRLRRVAAPMREVVSAAMRTEPDDQVVVDLDLMPRYQDVYDHATRLQESIEGLRDLLTSMYEARIAMADHTLNEVMKKLASWAAIIAVPTAVTGFYGQNVPYPGFGTHWGFAVSTATWVGLAVVIYVVLRRQRWL